MFIRYDMKRQSYTIYRSPWDVVWLASDLSESQAATIMEAPPKVCAAMLGAAKRAARKAADKSSGSQP